MGRHESGGSSGAGSDKRAGSGRLGAAQGAAAQSGVWRLSVVPTGI